MANELRNTRPVSETETRLAVITSSGLGDTLIQMVLANSLQGNGYQVCLYSDYGRQLATFVDAYRIEAYPSPADLLSAMSEYHVVLYDCGSRYLKTLSAFELSWLDHNAIAYRLSKSHVPATELTRQDLAKKLKHDPNVVQKVEQLIALNRSLRTISRFARANPIVEQLITSLRKRVRLENVSNATGLSIQDSYAHRDNGFKPNRILIHPSGSIESKCWSSEKYVELTGRLLKEGYEPVITVAPSERLEWRQECHADVGVPEFKDVGALAKYYLTGAFFIGNDSGNAHLASCLGIPTLQLFPGWRSAPSWRAGWAENKVVNALAPSKFSRNHWQKGLSVDRVLREFEQWLKTLGPLHLKELNQRPTRQDLFRKYDKGS